MLGTSDSWSTSHSSQRTSEPAYYIVDCRISELWPLQIATLFALMSRYSVVPTLCMCVCEAATIKWLAADKSRYVTNRGCAFCAKFDSQHLFLGKIFPQTNDNDPLNKLWFPL